MQYVFIQIPFLFLAFLFLLLHMSVSKLNSSGLGLKWFEAEFQFPSQRQKSGHAVRVLNHSHQITRDQQPVTRPCPISCAEMNFHRQTESSEADKVFIRSKRVQYMYSPCTCPHGWTQREPRPHGRLSHFCHFFQVSFGQSSCTAWF